MGNTSATGGYLQFAATPAPIDDQALDIFFQNFFVGILGTAIPGDLFFPEWQPEPANLPTLPTTNWAAFGITVANSDTFAFFQHVAANPPAAAYDEEQRHEELQILISFYGPNCRSNARTLRDGLQVRQNLAVLKANSMGLVSTGGIVTLPELVKERWLYRADLPCTIRRQIVRQIPILDLAAIDVEIETQVNDELYTENITVTE